MALTTRKTKPAPTMEQRAASAAATTEAALVVFANAADDLDAAAAELEAIADDAFAEADRLKTVSDEAQLASHVNRDRAAKIRNTFTF
ncbi:hypothetical protein [Kribbella sp. CA-293567]|uniref:hypothetical protein n=1 Tax=Kribbella sp. CA-293567 TaxID=3002436 RepID=UPI0022DD8F75|nr:hypothetical protein [Kribbella sp. CA-293567]WBQ03812.1 hypothetical protein OX958_28060 [Kribbella sp. CA-293567]